LPKKEQEKIKRLTTIEEIEAMFPGFEAFIDATEQEVPRSKNKTKRKTHSAVRRKNIL